jgi:hypothetical protein
VPENRIRLVILGSEVTLESIAASYGTTADVLLELNPEVKDATAHLKPGAVVWAPARAGYRDEPEISVDRIEALRRRIAPRMAVVAERALRLRIVLEEDSTTRRAQRRGEGAGELVNKANISWMLDNAKRGAASTEEHLDRHLSALAVRVYTAMEPALNDAVTWRQEHWRGWERVRIPPPYVESIHANGLRDTTPIRGFYNREVLTCYDRNLDLLCRTLVDLTAEVEALYDGCGGGPADLAQYQILTEYLKVLQYLRRRFNHGHGPQYFGQLIGAERVAETTREIERLLLAAREKALTTVALMEEVVHATSRDAFEREDRAARTLQEKVLDDFKADTTSTLRAPVVERLAAWRRDRAGLEERLKQQGLTLEQLDEIGAELTTHQRRLHALWYLAMFAWHEWKLREDINCFEGWWASRDELRRDLQAMAQTVTALYDAGDHDGFAALLPGYDALFDRIQANVGEAKFVWMVTKEVLITLVACAATAGAGALLTGTRLGVLAAVRVGTAARVARVGVIAIEAFVFTATVETLQWADGRQVTAGRFGYEWFKNALIFGALKRFMGAIRGLEESGRVANAFAVKVVEFVGSYLVLTLSAAPFMVLEVYHRDGALPGREAWVQFFVVSAVMLGGIRIMTGLASTTLAAIQRLRAAGTGTLETDLRRLTDGLRRQEDETLRLERELLRESAMTEAKLDAYKQRYRERVSEAARSREAVEDIRQQLLRLEEALANVQRHGAPLRLMTAEELATLGDFLARALRMLDAIRFRPTAAQGLGSYLTVNAGTAVRPIARNVIEANVPTILAQRATVERLPAGQEVKLLPAPDPLGGAPLEGALDVSVRAQAPQEGVDIATSVRVVDPRGDGRADGLALPPFPAREPALAAMIPESAAERLTRLAASHGGARRGVDTLRTKLDKGQAVVDDLEARLPEDFALTDALELAGKLQTPRALEGLRERLHAKGARALVELCGKARDLSPAALTAMFEGKLAEISRGLRTPVHQVRTQEGGIARFEEARKTAIAKLRARDAPFENFVEAGALATFREAMREALGMVRERGADLIVGDERGGALLAETLVEGEAALRPRVVRFPRKLKEEAKRARDAGKTNAQAERAAQELFDATLDARVTPETRRIVLIDSLMGGGSRNFYSKLIVGYLRDRPSLQVDAYWIRETFGFEAKVEPEGIVLMGPGAEGDASGRFRQVRVPVRWVLGDDMRWVCEEVSRWPIYIFDDTGFIIDVWAPHDAATPGAAGTTADTTRRVFVRKVWEER